MYLTPTFHTPTERPGRSGQTYLYRVVRVVGPNGKPTTVSADWTLSQLLLTRCGWSPGMYRKRVRSIARALYRSKKYDPDLLLSKQIWAILQRRAPRHKRRT